LGAGSDELMKTLVGTFIDGPETLIEGQGNTPLSLYSSVYPPRGDSPIEAFETGLLSPKLAAGIRRVKAQQQGSLKTRDGSRQKNDPFKEFEERRVLCAFASMGECPVAVLWVRRSETNRPSKCLEDTRGELARKGLTHRRMSNDSPKIKWSCQRVNEQVGVGIPRQFSGRDGLLDQV
jgi:hypothetical protein